MYKMQQQWKQNVTQPREKQQWDANAECAFHNRIKTKCKLAWCMRSINIQKQHQVQAFKNVTQR